MNGNMAASPPVLSTSADVRFETLIVPHITEGGPADPAKRWPWQTYWVCIEKSPDGVLMRQRHKAATPWASVVGTLVGKPDPIAEMQKIRERKGDENLCAYRVVCIDQPWWCIAASHDEELLVHSPRHHPF